MNKARILIVEDEIALAKGLEFNFEQEGYDVELAGDGPTAIEKFASADPPFDLVFLDLMLPCMSGYETCESLREIDSDVPIIVLSARTLSDDKIQAFNCGTDQYVTKPFELPELLSRVRNLLERQARIRATVPAKPERHLANYTFDNIQVDFNKFEITVSGIMHHLTTMEVQLLRYFIDHEGHVLSRERILADVWGHDSDVTTRTIDNFVLRLRKRIEADPSTPRHILSVRGTGYRFVADA